MEFEDHIRELEKRLKKAMCVDELAFGKSKRSYFNAAKLELQDLKEMNRLKNQGHSFADVGLVCGVSTENVRGWLAGKSLPNNLASILEKPAIPKKTSAELAYILGIYSAVNYGKKAEINFSVKGSVKQKLVGCIDKLWPGKFFPTKDGVHFGVRDVVRYFHIITKHNSTLPWEHLGAAKERLEYLRGAFTRNTEINKSCFILKKNPRKLALELRAMFYDLGMYPVIKKIKKWQSLCFCENDLARLLELDVLPENKKRFFANFDTRYVDIVKKYYAAQLYKAVYSLKKIAGLVDVPEDTVSYWFNPVERGKKRQYPAFIKNYREIERSKNDNLFDTFTVSFLYKNCDVSPDYARELATSISIEDLMHVYSNRDVPTDIEQVVEEVMGLKKREVLEYRDLTHSLAPYDEKGDLYEQVKELRATFGDNPRACYHIAGILGTKYNIPSKFIYEWIADITLDVRR